VRSGVRRGDGDTFFGCNFLSAPATERFDQSLNPLSAPIWLAIPRTIPPPHLYRLVSTTSSSSSSISSSHCHPGHPTAATHSPYHRPISPPYRCSITFAMHFFPSSFFIKLDYNCIASSSCGIAGRKNGTLPGMRVHPRSTRPCERERKEGERGCGRANDRFWRNEAEGTRGVKRRGAERASSRRKKNR